MFSNLIIFFSKLNRANRVNLAKSGFTLVEVMVSAAIIVVIASVVVYNHQKFDNDLELNNVAYKIASMAREAQVYGISSREAVTGSDPFKTSYGLHFTNTGSASSFIFFADLNNNSKYRENLLPIGDYEICAPDGSLNECIEQISFGRGIKIKNILVSIEGNPGWAGLPFLDIIFKRPSPDALIYGYGDYLSPSTYCSGGCGSVAICLVTPQGKNKQVIVLSTGQISVENVVSGQMPCGLGT